MWPKSTVGPQNSMSLVFRHRFPLQRVGANQSGIIACLLRGKIFSDVEKGTWGWAGFVWKRMGRGSMKRPPSWFWAVVFFNHVGIMRGSREKCVVFLSDVGVDAGGLFWSWWSGSRAHKGMTSIMTGIVVSQKGV